MKNWIFCFLFVFALSADALEREEMTEITKENFFETVLFSKNYLVVFFYVENCPLCDSVASQFLQLHAKYGEKIKFARVNVSHESQLAAHFNIWGVPGFLFIEKGDGFWPYVAKTRIGARSKEELDFELDRFIKESRWLR